MAALEQVLYTCYQEHRPLRHKGGCTKGITVRARFVTFEGGEGAGKSTQLRLFAERLKKAHIAVEITREPGGTPGAEAIRELLVRGEVARWTPLTEAFLHLAARADHVARFIQPALKAGKWVLCDRFADSTVAYQGYGHGLDRTAIAQLNKLALGDVRPDLTLIFDLPVTEGLARSRKPSQMRGEDRYEKMDTSFHERIRQGFLAIAAQEPQRCRIINATGTVDMIAEQVASITGSHFDINL